MSRIKVAMGGYVAEQLIYQQTSTGTKNDIEQATNIARKMVQEWGMSEKLGFIAFGQEDEPIFLGKQIAQHKDYSENTAQKIDEEIQQILKECMNEVEKLLLDHKDQLTLLAETLVEKETLDDREIRELIGFPPLENEENKS
jgi:cell division protease FtsH